MRTTRRSFLGTACASTSLLFLDRLLAEEARAGIMQKVDPAQAHFFLFFQMAGAWDICLAFDPQDREQRASDGGRVFDQPYSIEQVKAFAGIPLAPAGQVLGPYASRMAVINGIDMGIDNGHIVDTMMTGVTSPRASNTPYVQAVLSARHPYLRGRKIPHLYASYDGQFIPGSFAGATLTATAPDMASLFGGNAGASSGAAVARKAALARLSAQHASRLNGADDKRAYAQYAKAMQDAEAVQGDLSRIGFGAVGDLKQPAELGGMLGRLFASGILGAASLSLRSASEFDTHADHYKKHPLPAALKEIAGVMDALNALPLADGVSVLDRTTVILTSEFCRPPLLNSSLGKDHNFRNNSLVMIGHGVRAGLYGASGMRRDPDGTVHTHAAQPVDLLTGKPRADGEILRVAQLWAGLGSCFGVDLSREFGSETRPIRFLG